jgi:hypothetical protein
LEFAKSFPAYYARLVLGYVDLYSHEIPGGTAWILDCEKKTLVFSDKSEPFETVPVNPIPPPPVKEEVENKGVLLLSGQVLCADCGRISKKHSYSNSARELEAKFRSMGWKKTKHGWVCGCLKRDRYVEPDEDTLP